MTRAQRKTARTLARTIPGADRHPDPYTTSDDDAPYLDGSVLVHFTRPHRSEEPDERGRRRIVAFDALGHARIGRGGYVMDARLRHEAEA